MNRVSALRAASCTHSWVVLSPCWPCWGGLLPPSSYPWPSGWCFLQTPHPESPPSSAAHCTVPLCRWGSGRQHSFDFTLSSQQQCFRLPVTHFFKYLQVRHYISTQVGGHSPSTDEIIKGIQNPKGIVFLTYSRMLDLMANTALSSRVKLEQNLGFKDYKWGICVGAQNFSHNSCHRLLQINLNHKIYLTPGRLQKMTTPSRGAAASKAERGKSPSTIPTQLLLWDTVTVWYAGCSCLPWSMS